MADQQTTPRDEARIRHNLTRYMQARSEYGHLSWKAQNAKTKMKLALADLRAVGGHAEAEKYANG